ncbi:hypothetical protein QBC47DRAFT_39750 [Echria macrotheca]|uniref:Uncharacterized protein n=1 Tax=Echria macrotheca TaxID=438768 RepID=A0AAJ0F569_9PEZI|nr:hypothetical protein QBC47DRAFT_39750 [Echria macrotheca]
MRLANSDSTVPGLPSSVSENSPESSHERISNPSRTASTVSSSTIEVPRLPTPPSLDNDGRKLVADLEAAIEASRAAETLHAYDVGVCAALESMAKHWNAQAAQFHTSNSEKRIFQREAQRLEDLIIRAQQQVHVGDRRLILKRAEEKRLWAEVEKTQGARGDAINATVDRLVENTERMRLEGGPDKELFSRAAGMLSDTERDLESGGAEFLRNLMLSSIFTEQHMRARHGGDECSNGTLVAQPTPARQTLAPPAPS